MDEKQKKLISQYLNSKKPNIHYCKECGCIIDPDFDSTKQDYTFFKKENIPLLILSILLILFSLCLIISIHRIHILNLSLEQTQNILQEKDLKINELNAKLLQADEENTFFNKNCAIVLDGGKVYHTYNCYFFQNSTNDFFIYTTEQAEAKGYRPCKKCHESGSQ